MTDVAAAAREELDGVVEHRRVRARLVEHGCRELVSEPRLTRAHPRDVAAQRVDLTVVAEEPKRLRALPRGRRVRREALMEDRERNLERRVAQVRVEGVELIGRAERLVGDGAKRERRDVRAADALGPSAGAIGTRLGLVRAEAERPNEHELLDPWHRRDRRVAERVAVDGHLPPPGEPDPLGLARGFDARRELHRPEGRPSRARTRGPARARGRSAAERPRRRPSSGRRRPHRDVASAAAPPATGRESRVTAGRACPRQSRCHRSRARFGRSGWPRARPSAVCLRGASRLLRTT